MVTGLHTTFATFAGTIFAKTPDEALVDDEGDGGSDGGLIGAEDEQAFEDALARAGVQRGNHEMPGERGADGDVRGFFVANFTNHEHLGILPEQMPRGLGEVQSAGFIHFGLHDAGNDLFGGILDRDDVAAAEFGEELEARVNGRGLAAPGGAGQQEQTGSLPQEMFELGVRVLGEIEFAQLFSRGGTEKPQNNFFARHRRVSGDANIIRALDIAVINAPILRQGFLVGFEPREKFDPANDALGDGVGEFGHRRNHAIEAEGDLRGFPAHLQMNIARARTFGALDQRFQNLRRLSHRFVNFHRCRAVSHEDWTRRRQFHHGIFGAPSARLAGTIQLLSYGERSRLGCCSVRLAPNIGGVAITKRWVDFERLCEPRGAAHCARGGRAPPGPLPLIHFDSLLYTFNHL
jgi:hypothetical protein